MRTVEYFSIDQPTLSTNEYLNFNKIHLKRSPLDIFWINFSEILLAIPIEVEHNFFIEKKMEGNVFLVRKAKDNSEKSLKMSFLLLEINKTEKITL